MLINGEEMKVTKRKGISTFIATLLLMVLAVAAGVVIYAYVMGYLGGFSTPTTMGAISIDTSQIVVGGNGTIAVTAYIRNIGHATFAANTVYVNGLAVPATCWSFTGDSGTTSIAENHVGILRIKQYNNGAEFLPSVTYTIKLIGIDNTQLSFNVKG